VSEGVGGRDGDDALNRLRNLDVTRGGSPLHGYEYRLKVSGHREQILESTGRASVYGYDGLHRMVTEQISGDPAGQNGLVSYGLDAVGNRANRLSTVGLLAAQNYTYNARNHLQGDTYDANGNTVLNATSAAPGPVSADTYDFKNRLIQRTEPSGRVLTFLYDADGTRIGKRVDPNDGGATEAKATFFLNDTLNPTGYSQVLEQLDGGGTDLSDLGATLTLTRVYSIGLDLIGYDAVGTAGPNGPWEQRFFAYDGHGSVRQLLDESGAVLETYTYDAFGVLLSAPPDWNLPTANCNLYTGERLDSDLSLYYLRARYMDPATGRFHTMDTYEGSASDPLTLHKYLYAHHDPVSYIDPCGKFALLLEFGVSRIFDKVFRTVRAVVRLRKIGKGLAVTCARIYDGYKAASIAGAPFSCRAGLPRFNYDTKIIFLSLEIAGRNSYLKMGCDTWLKFHPNPRRRPKVNRNAGHKIELANKRAQLAKCQVNKKLAIRP
jgi:RHS repeat-associated protein